MFSMWWTRRKSIECVSGTQGLIMGLQSDTFISDRAKPSLTCRCQMGDNYKSCACSLFMKRQIAICDIDFVDGIAARDRCIV